MKKMLLTLSVITAMLAQALTMPMAAAAEDTAENIITFSNPETRYLITDYASSNLSVSGGKAICSSKLTATDKTASITATQYLEKRSGKRWSISKVWVRTVNSSSINMTNTCSAASDGTYRLRTVFRVYISAKSETVTKLSSYKTVSRGIIIADEEPSYEPAAEEEEVKAPQEETNTDADFEEKLAMRLEEVRAFYEEQRVGYDITDEEIDRMVKLYEEGIRQSHAKGEELQEIVRDDSTYRTRCGYFRIWKDGQWAPVNFTNVYVKPDKVLTENKGVFSGGIMYEYDPELKRLIIDGIGSFDPLDYENLYSSFDYDYVVIGKDVIIPPNLSGISMDEGIALNSWIFTQTQNKTSWPQPRFIAYEGSDFAKKYSETSRYGLKGDQQKIQEFINSHEVVFLSKDTDIHSVVYDMPRIPRSNISDIDENTYFTYYDKAKILSIFSSSDETAVLDMEKLTETAREYIADFEIDNVYVGEGVEVPGYEEDTKAAEAYLLKTVRKAIEGAEDKYSMKTYRTHVYDEDECRTRQWKDEYEGAPEEGTVGDGISYKFYPEKRTLMFSGKGNLDIAEFNDLIGHFDYHYIENNDPAPGEATISSLDNIIIQKDVKLNTIKDKTPEFSMLSSAYYAANNYNVYACKNSDFAKQYNISLDQTAVDYVKYNNKYHFNGKLREFKTERANIDDSCSFYIFPKDCEITLDMISDLSVGSDEPAEPVKSAEPAGASEPAAPAVTGESIADVPEENDDVPFVWGDADLSGTVGISDMIMIGKRVISPAYYPISGSGLRRADVVKDDKIDALDMNRMTEYLLGKVSYEELGK